MIVNKKSNKTKIWTIVINCYNSTKTIIATLESLDLQRNDIQVFVIDDGSKDNLKKCIKRFLDKYPDTIKYFRKANGNWGSCVNFAIKKCQTRFMSILDSDDEYVTKSFNLVANLMKRINEDVDIIFTNHLLVSRQTNQVTKKYLSTTLKEIKYINLEKIKIFNFPTIHSVIFSTRLLKETKPLPSNIFYTDSILLYYVMQKVNWIAFLNKNIFLYKYYIYRNDQSINIKTTLKNIRHLKCVYQVLLHNPTSKDASKKRIAISAKMINYIFMWLIKTIAQDYRLSTKHKTAMVKYFATLLKNFIDKNPHYKDFSLSYTSYFLDKNPTVFVQILQTIVQSIRFGLVGATNFSKLERKAIKKYKKGLSETHIL